jgi:hypothetical protein
VRQCRVCVLAVVIGGCGTLAGLVKVQQSATIVLFGRIAEVVAPDTVAHSSSFDVQYTSFENKCTDLVRDELTVRNDSVLLHSVVARTTECGDALVFLPHVFHVQINAPGAYRVYVNGRKEAQDFFGDTVISRPIVVR